jgi:hypothetical protein
MQKNQARTVKPKEREQKAKMGLGIATFWDPSASKAVAAEAGGVTTDAIPSCTPRAKESESTLKIRIKQSRKIKSKPSSYVMGGQRRGGVRYGREGLSAARHCRPTAGRGGGGGRGGSATAAGAAAAAAAGAAAAAFAGAAAEAAAAAAAVAAAAAAAAGAAAAAAAAATCRDEKGSRWVGGARS